MYSFDKINNSSSALVAHFTSLMHTINFSSNFFESNMWMSNEILQILQQNRNLITRIDRTIQFRFFLKKTHQMDIHSHQLY